MSEKRKIHLAYISAMCNNTIDNMNGKYAEWSEKKSYDLAEILEFMRIYQMKIPRYMRRTRFYRKKKNELLNVLTRKYK